MPNSEYFAKQSRFINRKKRLSDLFLDNAHSSMILIELLLRKSTIGCYWVPDDDYRLFFGVLINMLTSCCAPLVAQAMARTHIDCVLLTRLHKFHHEAFPSARCPVHSPLNPHLLMCQPRWHPTSLLVYCPGSTWLAVRSTRATLNVLPWTVVNKNIPANHSSLCISVPILLEQTSHSIHDLLQQRQIMIGCWFLHGQ